MTEKVVVKPHVPGKFAVHCRGGRTRQAHRAECDINNIVEKARRTGLVGHLSNKSPYFADVSYGFDYQSALGLVMDAQERFKTLPSVIRERFGNDPAALLAFLSDPKNREEGQKLGLIKPDEVRKKDPKGSDEPITEPKAPPKSKKGSPEPANPPPADE